MEALVEVKGCLGFSFCLLRYYRRQPSGKVLYFFHHTEPGMTSRLLRIHLTGFVAHLFLQVSAS